MAATSIEWADAVWNPVAGCTWASAGCDHCYAATMTRRLEGMGQKDYSGLTTAKHFNGKVNLLPHKLSVPIQRKKPTRYFVNSMSDLFHKDVPGEFIDRVFAVMALCPQHTFMVLTKRPDRMAKWFSVNPWNDVIVRLLQQFDSMPLKEPAGWLNYFQTIYRVTEQESARGHEWPGRLPLAWPLPNIWLGVSVENQEQADKRIPFLLQTPAAVRFLSCEPLLGPVDLSKWLAIPEGTNKHPHRGDYNRFDWVIVGGESGHGARPMHPKWPRDLRDQCKAAGVPYFHKQNGEWAASGDFMRDTLIDGTAVSHPKYPPYSDITHGTRGRRGESIRVDGGPQLQSIPFASDSDIIQPFAAHVCRVCLGWFATFSDMFSLSRWRDAIIESGGKSKAVALWLKPDCAPQFNGQKPATAFEAIALFWIGPGCSSWNGGGARGIYSHPTNNRERHGVHPTEKPVSLMTELVNLYSNESAIILDPFMGSGTTGVACVKTGRRFLGIERERKYCDIAVKRMQKALDERAASFDFMREPEPVQATLWE